ncbi:MAG: hypothetical protein WCI55_11305 [Armatimonadota bacterium]
MAENKNHDNESLLGCLVEPVGSCLIELLLAGIGCIVPTMGMAILLVGGISWKAKPMKRFGTQIVAKIQRLRLRPIKGIHLSAKPRSFSAQTA